MGKSFVVKKDSDINLFMPSIGIDCFNYGLNSSDGVEVFGDAKDGISLNLEYLTKHWNIKLSFIDYFGRFFYSLLTSQEYLNEAQKLYKPDSNAIQSNYQSDTVLFIIKNYDFPKNH